MLLTHRYYDPINGRFLTRDPIGYGGGINLYGFAGNNPVNDSDPSGFTPSGGQNYSNVRSGNPYLTVLFAQPSVQHLLKGLQQARDFTDGVIDRNFGPTVDVYPAGQGPSCGCGTGFPVFQLPHDAPQSMSMMAGKGGGKLPTGLRDASPGLKELFSSGSIRGRSIIGIRQTLLKDGFKMTKTKGFGYLFKRLASKEQVRVMSRNGGWDVRVQNGAGNNLDEYGNTADPASTHGINVFSK